MQNYILKNNYFSLGLHSEVRKHTCAVLSVFFFVEHSITLKVLNLTEFTEWWRRLVQMDLWQNS